MIQLKENEKSKQGTYNIYIDDSSSTCGWAYKTFSVNNFSFQYFANGVFDCWELGSQTIEDFEPFSVITFNNLFSWMKRSHSIIISDESDKNGETKILKVSFYFSPNLAVWNEKYSFADYVSEFRKCIEKIQEPEYDIIFESDHILRLDFYVKRSFYQLEELLVLLEKDIKYAHQTTVSIFQKKFQRNLIQSTFDFPKEIKVSCEQYLLYFSLFLQDLGIDATSNLMEETGKILFSVTPTNDIEALDKIREALAIYLNLPASPIVYDDSFAAMRLQQQIENLQHSQKMAVRELQFTEKLLVAQSETIQEKNLIISQKDSTIEQQQKIIDKITSKSIMMDSLESKEEFVEIFEGLEIGDSKLLKEHLGIKFNPAKSLKTLGRKIIKKGEKLTSIDIDVKNED